MKLVGASSSHLGAQTSTLFEVLGLNASQNLPQLSQSCAWAVWAAGCYQPIWALLARFSVGSFFSGFLSNISRCFVMFMSWIWVLFSKTPSSSAYNLTEHVTQIFWKKLMMLPKASVILLLQILTVYPKQVVLAQLLFQVKQLIRNKKIAVTKEDWQLKNSVLPQTLKALKQHHYDWK